MRQKHTGADGEVKFVAHRNLYVGFMGGKVVCTKRTAEACHAFLANLGVKPTKAKKATVPAKSPAKPKRKVGHATVTADTAEALAERVAQLSAQALAHPLPAGLVFRGNLVRRLIPIIRHNHHEPYRENLETKRWVREDG